MSRSTERKTCCDRRGGIFSPLVDELSYFRRGTACQTCGADPHWEQQTARDSLATNTPQDTEYQLVRRVNGRPKIQIFPRRWRNEGGNLCDTPWVSDLLRGRWRLSSAQKVSASNPITPIRDVDGTWIFDPLGQQSHLNNGKTHTVRHSDDNDELKRLVVDLGADPDREFLTDGGWFRENARTTRRPIGRPAKGLRGDRLARAVERVLADRGGDDDPARLNRRQLRAWREELMRHFPEANTQSVADYFEISLSGAEKLMRAVRADKSPKRGEASSLSLVLADLPPSSYWGFRGWDATRGPSHRLCRRSTLAKVNLASRAR